MNRPLKIGPDGSVEFATEREMAHLTHCLEREATTDQSKSVNTKVSYVDFALLNEKRAREARKAMKSCPKCNCRVREDRLQTHVETRCPARANSNPTPSTRKKSTASFSRKKSAISMRDIQLFVKCPLCGSEIASDQFIKHRTQAHGRPRQTFGKSQPSAQRYGERSHATSVGDANDKRRTDAKHPSPTGRTAPGLARKTGEVEVERPAWWDNLDATKNRGYPAREEGRYGSYPSHDGFDDESNP